MNVRVLKPSGGEVIEPQVDGSDAFSEELGLPWTELTRRRRLAQGGRMRRRALLVADIAGLLMASALVGFAAGFVGDSSFVAATGVAVFTATVGVLLWVGFGSVYGIYRREEQRADLTTADDVLPILVIVSLELWSILVAFTVLGIAVPASILVGLWFGTIPLLLAFRAVARTLARRSPHFLENTLIVGAGDVGQLLGRKVTQHPELGLRLVGFVDDDPKAMRRDLTDVPVVGHPGQLEELIERLEVQRIIVSFSNESHGTQLELVHALRDLDVQVDVIPRLFEAMGPTVGMHYVEGLPLVALPSGQPTVLARATKRVIDIVGASLALILLSPLFVVIAWKIKRDSHGPVFFRQERLGERMARFQLLKFRTMGAETDEEPHRAYVESIMDTSQVPSENNLYKLSREGDVTEVGAWLRRWSLDELPQFVNVLRGEMSLVGPRPCMAYETDFFEPHHYDRFLVPAGMTGLWQVTARARTTFREALDLDVAYARNWSLGLDLKLMLKTPLIMLRPRATA